MNIVANIGRVSKEPYTHVSPEGKYSLFFDIAIDRPTGNQQAEKITDYPPIALHDKYAETMADKIKLGQLVSIEGSIQTYMKGEGENKEKKVVVKADHIRILKNPSANNTDTEDNTGEQQ